MRMPASTPWAMQMMSMTIARASGKGHVLYKVIIRQISYFHRPGSTESLTVMKLENPKQVQAMTKGQGDSRKRPK